MEDGQAYKLSFIVDVSLDDTLAYGAYSKALTQVDAQIEKLGKRLHFTPISNSPDLFQSMIVSYYNALRRGPRQALLNTLMYTNVLTRLKANKGTQQGILYQYFSAMDSVNESMRQKIYDSLPSFYPLFEDLVDSGALVAQISERISKEDLFQTWHLDGIVVGNDKTLKEYSGYVENLYDTYRISENKGFSWETSTRAVVSRPSHALFRRVSMFTNIQKVWRILLPVHVYMRTPMGRKVDVCIHKEIFSFPIFINDKDFAPIIRMKRAYRIGGKVGGCVHTTTLRGTALLTAKLTSIVYSRVLQCGAFFVLSHVFQEGVVHEDALRYVDEAITSLEDAHPGVPKGEGEGGGGGEEKKDTLLSDVLSFLVRAEEVRIGSDTTSLKKLSTPLRSRKGVSLSSSKRPSKRTTFSDDKAKAWAVEFPDGSVYASPRAALLHDFTSTARACVNACIASFMLNRFPAYANVTYVSSDSIQDTYY